MQDNLLFSPKNKYVTKFNIPVEVEFDFDEYIPLDRTQIAIDNHVVPLSIVTFLEEHGIMLQWAEVFVLKPGQNHPAHIDGHKIDTKAKFNYIVGGANSTMLWYETNINTVRHHTTRTGNKCLMANDQENVVPVYEESVSGFIVANVGILHNVINPTEYRFCLSMALADKETGTRLMYEQVVEKLSEFKILN